MALNKNDEKIIRAIFKEELEPTKVRVQTHHQTIYGSDEKGGMRAEVIRLDAEIEKQKIFRTQIKTIVFAIVPAIQLAIVAIFEWVMSKFRG